ncbi:class V lanthionine synthetase subunit LxmK [Kitasatospora sp. NPDC006697]|uniref:class V lanthionine synthetase subunit LxmK n=1 Tax=Kitasatospora sp. NPDC006697 TaxID=3364020 RepID=UPI00367BB6FB
MSAPDTARTVLEPAPLETAPEVADLLAELGVGALVRDQIGSYAGRNDNWFGPTAGGTGVFVKRLSGPNAPQRLERMACFDRTLELARQRGAELSWDTPKLMGIRPAVSLAVFELLDGAQSLTDLSPLGELPDELARRVGQALAEVHALPATASAVALDGQDTAPGTRVPLIMQSLEHLSQKTWQASSAAELELWALLQHDAVLSDGIRAVLRERTGTTGLVPSHGDLRLDQFLLHRDRLYLTDWEEFRLAPPESDLGSLIGEFVHRAVRCLANELDDEPAQEPEAAHAEIMNQGRRALARIRPTVTALLEAYRRTRGPVDTGRIAAQAGWHLFDRIFATARHANRLDPLDRAQAGIGRTLILAPQRSAAAIGLTEAY